MTSNEVLKTIYNSRKALIEKQKEYFSYYKTTTLPITFLFRLNKG